MINNRGGQISSLWLPRDPAEAIVSTPSVIASAGSLRNRIEMGYNHPCAIPGTVLLLDFTEESTTFAYDKSGLGNDAVGTSIDAALYLDTPFGKAYGFPSITDWFNLNDDSINDLTDVTVEVIFNYTALNPWSRLFSQYASSTDTWNFTLNGDGDLVVRNDIDNAGANL